jgi:hypothetical protein
MTQQHHVDTSGFIGDFERALVSLDVALGDAARAVSTVRSFVPQIAALAQAVSTIETAVTNARQGLDLERPASAPAPVQEPAALHSVSFEPAPEPAPAVIAQPADASKTSQCARITITKSKGSLDLKSIDSALNEHPEIVDLALLDYDGRNATLKLWVSGPQQQEAFQATLEQDILRRAGDDAQVSIEFDQESAAA